MGKRDYSWLNKDNKTTMVSEPTHLLPLVNKTDKTWEDGELREGTFQNPRVLDVFGGVESLKGAAFAE